MKLSAGTALMLFILMGCGGSSGSLTKRVVLSELCSANASVIIGDTDKNCTEWLEIANTGEVAVDITGYYLTDDPAVPDKWAIPSTPALYPGKALIFWADKLGVLNHTNFKLKLTPGKLALYSPAKELVDSVEYPAQTTDISYGRASNGEWRYCATPTPGQANAGVMTVNSDRTGLPVFSQQGGFYPASVTVSLTADPGAVIRYTLDGSIPKVDSTAYASPILISSTKVLRARAFAPDRLPSHAVTNTFFINESKTLPVVSVSTDPANLFDPAVGLYVPGPNAKADPPFRNGNFWQDWERAANVELFEADGSRAFSHYCGVKINGNTTVAIPEKSLAFYSKAKYELAAFNYKLFPEKASTNYPRFLLRNSGQDWPLTLFRDALSASVVKGKMNLDYQAYRPVLHFLNGEYYGVINLREKADQYFAVSNYGATAGKIDFLEHNIGEVVVGDGSDAHYKALMAYLAANEITQSEVYDYVKTQMDVEEFMDYTIMETYCGNYDWPGENVKFWRAQSGVNNRWRWILQDTDYAWEYKTKYGFELDSIGKLLENSSSTWPNPGWSTLLFRTLIKNDAFRAEWLSRYQQHLGDTFLPSRILGIIDGIEQALEPEMARHIATWGGKYDNLFPLTPSPTNYCFANIHAWKVNIAVIRDFVQKRPAEVQKHLVAHFPGDVIFP